MPWHFFLRLALPILYRVGLAGIYGYFSFSSWESMTICYERITLLLFLIFFIGIHTCFTPARFYLKNEKFYDFEFTMIGMLIFISNEIEQNESCMDEGDDIFLFFSEYCFYSILLINCSCIFLYILWIFIYIMIRVVRYGESLSQQNILVFSNQDLNANNLEGLTFHELNRLKQMKYDKNKTEIRNKTCSICLNDFIDDENLIRLPECDHLFHNECIMDWLKGHIICPYCRCDIRAALEKENPLINRIDILENIEN